MRGAPRVRRPCDECPWRLDAAPGRFPAERYDVLRSTSRQRDEHGGHDADVDAPWFACHKTPEGAERSCAGWLAVEGMNHVGVRWAMIEGRLDLEALAPGADWPELHPSYDEMVQAQGYDERDEGSR